MSATYYHVRGHKRLDLDKILGITFLFGVGLVCGLYGSTQLVEHTNFMRRHQGFDKSNYIITEQLPDGTYVPHNQIKGRLQ